MSPRAAWRLESLGFTQVYDYVAGEADWFASGLPREGRDTAIPRAGDAACHDVPTCRPTDDVGAAWERVREAGWDTCVVVNDEDVVLGRMRGQAFEADPMRAVEQVMEAGPTTIRPDERLEELVGRMRDKQVENIIITTPDGRLLGVLRRADAEQHLAHG